jgi:hypothetical protein
MAGIFDTLTTLAPALIKGAGDIYGAISSSNANTKAAKKLAEAEQQKVALQKQVYGDLQDQSAPAVNYFRTTLASPSTLTPDQEDERGELERQTLNQVNRTGLRGSGRAVTSALRRVDADYVNGAMAQNRSRRDTAAGQLSGQYFSAADNLARGEGDAIEGAASAGAQAGINNASLRGQAIGDIGGLIASEIKGRDSAYSQPLDKLQELFGLRDTQPKI